MDLIINISSYITGITFFLLISGVFLFLLSEIPALSMILFLPCLIGIPHGISWLYKNYATVMNIIVVVFASIIVFGILFLFVLSIMAGGSSSSGSSGGGDEPYNIGDWGQW